MKKIAVSALSLTVLAVLLAACGAGSGPSRSLKVTMTDFAFSPNSFTVPAGEEISVEVANNGAVAHSFIIMQTGHPAQGHFTDADKANVFWEVSTVPPGESVKASFTAPSNPGEYQILCGIAGHFEAGMVGKLTVVSQP
jgi:uncharacterized cupredoxin-like copper-binding protein